MDLLDVLGSKSRLKIIHELTDGPRYVSELADEVGLDGKSTVHHLSTLADAGLVESYRVGNRKYYRLVAAVTLEATPPPERAFILQAQDATDVERRDEQPRDAALSGVEDE